MEYISNKKNKKKNKNKDKENSNKEKDESQNTEKGVMYFLMIPLEDENFVNEYKLLCSRLEERNPKNFNKNMLQKPEKLHMTLIVFDIKENKEKTEKIINIINEMNKEIINITSDELIYNFEKFDVFDSVEKTRVVFGKMYEDENNYKLKLLTNLLIKKFIENNILSNNDLKDLHVNEEHSDGESFYTIKFHLTLLNVKYLNRELEKVKQKTKKNFDSSEILQCINDIKLPECPITKMNLCAMRQDTSTSGYEIIKSFNIV